MKVIKSEEDLLEFDSGLKIEGEHQQDCCERNYLDFSQLPVGTELNTMEAADFLKSLSIKEDGFTVKDVNGLPKWVQARSEQSGYYSNGVDMVISDKNISIVPKRNDQAVYQEFFTGEGSEY